MIQDVEKNDKVTSPQTKGQACYFEQCVSKGGFFGDVAASEIKRLSRKYIGKKILDIGAGSGALIDILPKGAVGIDLSAKHPAVIKGDISQIPFGDESFDTIFAIEVIEHLDGDTLQRGLKEMFRVLQKGGNLVVTVPFEENLKANMVICPQCGAQFHKVGHVHSFNTKNITDLFYQANFVTKRIKIIPIGIMARYPFVKYFLFFLGSLIPSSSKNIFIVVTKR